MILTGALALSLTVGVTMYAASRGHSPAIWGGASVLISGASIFAAWVGVSVLGTSDWVFDERGGALAMLMALTGPTLAILGNAALASRLAALPAVTASVGSSWLMWKLGEGDVEGSACTLTVDGEAIVGQHEGVQLFAIAHANVSAIEVDGETLVVRTQDGQRVRMVLAHGDPDHRDAGIAEIRTIAKALERARPAVVAVLVCMIALASPRAVWAGNEAHVRTPVLWPSECGRVVDRSVDPIAHFEYSVPMEDTELTLDELPDSRTHQFVALCRQHALSELLPFWMTRSDVERSETAGLIEPGEVMPLDILDESPAWTDCFVRITADDDRRPITFAQAEAGVDWDTSEVAIGVWSLAGYTFEPPLNVWRDRPGFVKVLDDPGDPQQNLPAIALLAEEQAVEPGELLRFDACADVLEPAHIELEWARFEPTLDWQPLDTITIDADGPFTIEAAAPIAAADSELLVRARLIDALDREYVAHAPVRMSVAACPEQGCSEPPVDEARGCSTMPRTSLGGLSVLFGLLLLALGSTAASRRTSRACVDVAARA